MTNQLRDEDIERLGPMRARLVVMNDHFDSIAAQCFTVDHTRGGRIAARAFLELKHSQFAIIGGPADLADNRDRIAGFKDELAQYFTGKHVAIFPDNDDPGREHALKVAAILHGTVKSLKIVELPGLPAKGDVTDFANKGGTVEQIRELYRKAQPWTPDWEFGANVPDENDRYVCTVEQAIERAGGLDKFWNLASFTGIPTPFAKLNSQLGGGMRNGEVYVIGANQGAGKTSLALQFMMAALRKQYGTLLFSMEMDHDAVFHRMAGIEARVDLQAFRDKQRAKQDHRDELLRLRAATYDLASWPLLVSTKSAATPEYITGETRRIAKRAQVGMVVVDHMQLMAAEQNTRSEYEKFTAISRALKQTAMELKLPVLLVSQTSRANSRDKRSELDVSDLRGSGAIEEDAAGVFLLYEDSLDADEARKVDRGVRYAKGPLKTWLKIGKNRYGMQGTYVGLLHFKDCTRFDLPDYGEVGGME